MLTNMHTCPTGLVNPAIAGCSAITPDSLSGGNPNVGPETSKQWSVGGVFKTSTRLDFTSVVGQPQTLTLYGVIGLTASDFKY